VQRQWLACGQENHASSLHIVRVGKRRQHEAAPCDADLSNQTFKDRVAAVKTERDIAQTVYDRALGETNPRARITPFCASVEVLRRNVLTGETSFRRAYLRSVIDQVEVDDAEISIMAERVSWSGLLWAAEPLRPECPVLFPKWRARGDSNL
jgi:site-specific DNA recombinase